MDEIENVILDLSLPRRNFCSIDSPPSNMAESTIESRDLQKRVCAEADDVTLETSDNPMIDVYKNFVNEKFDETAKSDNAVLDLSLPKRNSCSIDSWPSSMIEPTFQSHDQQETTYTEAFNVMLETGDERGTGLYKKFRNASYNETKNEDPDDIRSAIKRPRYSDSYDDGGRLGDDDLAQLNESVFVTEDGYESDDSPICRTVDDVTVFLHDRALWHAFAKCGTEMIISRGGRRMFPHIVLSFKGLVPNNIYSVTLEIVPADNRRYKYINNQWMAMGMADPGPGLQPIAHSDSPNTGTFWAQNRASFSKVRLTNNKEARTECSDGNILLLSMHKYLAVITVRNETLRNSEPLVFRFEKSAFIAVTAYQNYKITHLKIKNNPFAKAFRDAHNTANRSNNSRRKDSAIKCESRRVRESDSNKALSNSLKPRRLNPFYYPFSGTTVRPYGFEFPGFDPFNPQNISQNMLTCMARDPWLTLREHMHAMWMKNSQSVFGSLPSVPRRPLSDAHNSIAIGGEED